MDDFFRAWTLNFNDAFVPWLKSYTAETLIEYFNNLGEQSAAIAAATTDQVPLEPNGTLTSVKIKKPKPRAIDQTDPLSLGQGYTLTSPVTEEIRAWLHPHPVFGPIK